MAMIIFVVLHKVSNSRHQSAAYSNIQLLIYLFIFFVLLRWHNLKLGDACLEDCSCS